MKRARFHLLIFLMAGLLPDAAFAQAGGTLEGHITDAQSGEPLPGANVFFAHTASGTSTDSSGYYALHGVAPGSYEFVASMIGFETHVQQVTVTPEDTLLTLDVRLVPTVYGLEGVTVTAERDRDWERYYRRFQDLFLGTSDNADETVILNPEVLDFDESRDDPDRRFAKIFSATARAPLRIENRALGYRITFVLTDFRWETTGDWLTIKGLPFFEALDAADDEEAGRWDTNRHTTFTGSLQHFLWALVHERVGEEGFVLREVEYLPPEQRFEVIREDVEPASILQQTTRSYEYRLRPGTDLLVNYAPKARRTFVGGLQMSREEQESATYLRTDGPVTVHESGYAYAPSASRGTLVLSGHLSGWRVADMLPREYPARIFGQ